MPADMPLTKKPKNEDPNPVKASQPPASPEKKKVVWTITKPLYTMEDLILDSSTQSQLLNAISYFENRKLLFDDWGLAEKFSSRDGLAVNLYGPPGTGKTMAAHAIASALGKDMICVNYAEIESMYVGETSKNLSHLFETAKEKDVIIFFDEADAMLSKRVANIVSSADVSVNQTRSVLLTLLNQYRGVVLFATNFMENLDAAFLRRILYKIEFHLPDKDLRERLWKSYIPAKMPCQADCAALAEKFSGISGSDISNAVLAAAISAARHDEKSVSQSRLEEAIQHDLDAKKANAGEIVTVSKQIVPIKEI